MGLAAGLPKSLGQLDKLLSENMDIKVLPRVGPNAQSVGRYLKREIRWHDDPPRFTWTGDERHISKMVELLDLGGCKPAETPGTKTTGTTMRDALEPLVGAELRLFPQVAGLVNYIAGDRPDSTP